MYFDCTVKIPQIKGKITVRKMGNFEYVHYELERVYDPKRKFNVPKRTIIGKRAAGDPTLMHPNEKFLELFPQVGVPEERQKADRSCCLKLGTHVVIEKVAEEYELKKLLARHFGKHAGLALDLVSYLIVNEDNAGQYYPDYAFTHPLFTDGMRILSDSSLSRFFADVSKDQIQGFLNDWNGRQDHRQRIYLSYDSTNENSQNGDIDIVEFGNAKDDKGLPIFNLSLAYDKTNKVPLFYEEYPGSINDVSQFKYLVDKVSEYGYRSIGFVLDRGYFSRANIEYMDEKKYHFVIMCKGCKPLVTELIGAKRGTFESDRGCYIPNYRIYGTTVKMPLFKGEKKERYFHLYYNPSRLAAEREKLEVDLEKMHTTLNSLKGRAVEIGAPFTKYFDLHYAPGKGKEPPVFLFATEKTDVIGRELDLCGYFCIISSEAMSAKDALLLYEGRDASEKLFRSDKSFPGSRSMRVTTNEAVSAMLFVEFVALIVRNRMYNLLKEQMMRLTVRRNYLTVPAAVKELDKIEMVRMRSGRYILDHAVTKTQRVILESFGLNEENIREAARAVDEALSIKRPAEEPEMNGEDDDAEAEVGEDY